MSCIWCKGREMNDHDCANFDGLVDEPMILEKTQEANRGFAAMTTRITVIDGSDGLTPDMLRRRAVNRSSFLKAVRIHDGADGGSYIKNGAAMDPFADETPIEASCDLENPESCESCT